MDFGLGQRIIVIGDSGSGKSTLGYQLAQHLDIPHIELDELFWEPNWTEAEPDVFRERIREALRADRWVMSGNYLSRQQDLSWSQADQIIWLDLPLRVTTPRLVRRIWSRWRSQSRICGDNVEDFWSHLRFWDAEKSLIAFQLTTHAKRRAACALAPADPRWAQAQFLKFRSSAQLRYWMTQHGVLATHRAL